MPSLFPTSGPAHPDDKNRAVTPWRPGDPRPKLVTVAVATFVIVALLMVFSGVGMWFLDWDRAPMDADEADYMAFVKRNVRILAVINLLLGAAIGLLAPRLLRGDEKRRTYLMWTSVVAVFFQLAGWVLGFAAAGQAVLALGLAIALLLAYRPQSNNFFTADAVPDSHNLDDEDGSR